ncbi:fatty acid hydroxylase superfamily protein [Rhodotorula toruloides]|uniref:Fatty acid hydroxylase superfamily protein n=1 Tax=Rhodotorula toruloides TaxID=5286 RepID=A0A511KBI6_RHOTO|nr:fatty acid hydroxylase superfamily protein [Rhodotorula toruloides]
MASLAALATGISSASPSLDAKQRRDSSSSTSSEEGETPISYATDPSKPPGTPAPRTTRQKVDRRPPSTFYLKPRSEMTLAERICNLATCPPEMHELKPESLDRGPVPTQSVMKENLYIGSRALVPLAVQQASHSLGYCVELGTFDEKQIGRDRTPDKSVGQLAFGITAYMVARSGFMFVLKYDRQADVLFDFTWTYPLRLMAWQLALDYAFYCYHRASHEVDSLWFIHKQHHTTKHPTAILAILAEGIQECLEVFLIPLCATGLVPMSFSEMWVTLIYTLYIEILGHSGVRSHWRHTSLFWLDWFGAGLAVEDHDLHHRFGKSGKNYGKQSRFWDAIFGTRGERIETWGM